jgi:hypothetical protein
MLQVSMKLPELYTDWRIVVGLALLLLGAGNWIVGLQRTQEYSEMIARASDVGPDRAYRSFDELSPGSGGAVLEPFTAEQRKVSYATARMDFYHATFLTGQVMLVVGLVLTLIGFVSAIRSDARRVVTRLGRAGGSDPPAR